jgi:hypothetical protein
MQIAWTPREVRIVNIKAEYTKVLFSSIEVNIINQ